MKKVLYAFCILHFTFYTLHSLPAFPGAEGWGAQTPGGRGGKVYVVTNLNESGPGSFNEGYQATGPRTIVFRVSGVIDVNSSSRSFYLRENHSHLTIAGQTSPGGITLVASGSARIVMCYQDSLHDVIFRFLRFRGQSNNEDAFTLNPCSNFILDHCDFSGAVDETQDLTHCRDFTLQWCTIANSSGGQNYGSLIAYYPTQNISMHHNLWANLGGRAGPAMHWGDTSSSNGPPNFGMIDYRNNICYNSGSRDMLDVYHANWEVHFNVVGNYFKAGPNTSSHRTKTAMDLPTNVRFYETDNVFEEDGIRYTDSLWKTVYGRNPTKVSTPYDLAAVITEPVDTAYESVLNKVGALPRDPMNIRTIGDVRNGTGVHRKDDDPLIQDGPALPADTDLDGMPDCWESVMGFNINDPSDNNGDHDGDGYTNIEEYINDMALAWVGDMPHNGMLEDGCPTAIEANGNHSLKSTMVTISPNPFNSNTTIQIDCRLKIVDCRLKIYNINGVLVEDLTSKIKNQKSSILNQILWTASGLPAGVYVIQLTSGKEKVRKKIFLLK
jgi:hypothetical protein